MVYSLVISYRGTAYAGWQRQNNALTVQQVVEEALSDVLGEPSVVIGAGRTDAGVHARGQVVHLSPARPAALGALVHGTNHRLPEDVRVLSAAVAADDFHARYSASGKEYRYRLIAAEVLSPLDAPFALRVEPGLDRAAMRAAAAAFVGRHDFSAFALAGGSHRSPVRTVTVAELLGEGDELVARVEGDGFLRGMVRSMVGTLLDVGRGRRSPDDVRGLLQGGPRSGAGATAPAHGLCLERVTYPPTPPGASGGSTPPRALTASGRPD